MKKLFLLDALALIYRAHYAFINNPRKTSKGLDTSAVFGFTNTLLEVLKKEKPTHIGVAFDMAGPTFRHEQFADYKANRQEQPEGITQGLPYIHRLIEAFNIPILMHPGFEADDIIGTLAKKAVKEGFQVYMMTSDKDYCQILEENVFVYKPATKFAPTEILDVQKALEKFRIQRVEQVTDMLGLQGDSVDNIPGLPGVGEKTAQKLIEQYQTVENLIAHAHELTGKIKDTVEKFKDQALLSKQLATIDINAPVEFEEDKLELNPPNTETLAKLFDELEFTTLKKRILGDSPQEKQQKSTAKKSVSKKTDQLDLFGNGAATSETFSEPDEQLVSEYDTIHTKPHRYHLIDTPALRKELIRYLSLQKEFCFDTETTSLDALQAELVGLSFAYYASEAYYVPVPADQTEAQLIVDEFKPVFENPAISKIAQNLKYDISILKKYGVEVKGKNFDTMLAHYLINPEVRHNMDFLAERYLNYTPVSIETLIGKKGKNQGNMRDVDISLIKEYAAEDADITWQLKQKLGPLIQQGSLEKLLYEVEMPLVEVLAEMEYTGVRIDIPALQEYSELLQKDSQTLEESIYQLAGEKFNIASPKQLGEVLFNKLKLMSKPPKTKSGQYATGEAILLNLAEEHPIVSQILEFRELQKLKSTYVDALPALLSPVDGRVHTSYNQAVTATGRLSSTNPNLQNIPIKTEKGREIRKAFIPSNEEYLILSADYSQIELRLMAALSQDETMLEAFEKGIDIHAATASKIYKVPVEEVTPDMRRKAKTANFAILYGSSAFGLTTQLKTSLSEAKNLIDTYYQEFKAVKKFKDDMIQKAREKEYVETVLGRKRYLYAINDRNQTMASQAERNAVNSPLQGTAADMIKIAMIRIHEFIKKEKMRSKMILQVHDELVFDAHISEIDYLAENVVRLMKNALPLPVIMQVETGRGKNWLEAH